MMEREGSGRISIPPPVGPDNIGGEDLEDVQVPLKDLDFYSVSVVKPAKAQKKASHVCIFVDCMKGKRGGTEFCVKHKKMGSAERERLAAKIYRDKRLRIVATPIDKPDDNNVVNPIEDRLVETIETVFTTQTEPIKNTFIIGSALIFISFILLIQTFSIPQNGEDMCGLSLVLFFMGILFLVKDSPSFLMSFTYVLVAVIAYMILFAILFGHHFTMGGGGVGGLSEWGGP